jgi:hypothetical protein
MDYATKISLQKDHHVQITSVSAERCCVLLCAQILSAEQSIVSED